MPLPTTRGIQYEDVAQAADALLHDGLRPTIERIRQRIGRGSPNTVSPMLERWFSALGQRLQTSQPQDTGNDGVPPALWQAAQDWWNQARQAAQQQAAQAYAADCEALAVQAQQLAQEKLQLDAREQALNERLRAMEESLQLCSQQLQESNERWKASQRHLAQKEEETAAQRHLIGQLTAQQAAIQQHLDAVQTQAAAERQATEERHHNQERRWMIEVDQARQQTKRAIQQTQEQERQYASLQTKLEQQLAAQQQQELQHQAQLAALQQELANAQGQAAQASLLLAQLQQSQAHQASQAMPMGRQPKPPSRVLRPVRRSLGKSRAAGTTLSWSSFFGQTDKEKKRVNGFAGKL